MSTHYILRFPENPEAKKEVRVWEPEEIERMSCDQALAELISNDSVIHEIVLHAAEVECANNHCPADDERRSEILESITSLMDKFARCHEYEPSGRPGIDYPETTKLVLGSKMKEIKWSVTPEQSAIMTNLGESQAEEITALDTYEFRAKLAEQKGDHKTAELYRHIGEEERQHAQEFSARLTEKVNEAE